MLNQAKQFLRGMLAEPEPTLSFALPSGLSYQQACDRIVAELGEQGIKSAYVRDLYEDTVVYCIYDSVGSGPSRNWKRSYTFDADGQVSFTSDPTEVAEKRTYEPVAEDMGQAYREPYQIFMDASQAFAAAATATPEWIPFLPKPGVHKHPKYGEVNVSREANQERVDSVRNRVYQEQIPLDAEHETKLSGAVAWLTDMRMNEDGSADAYVSWTSRGQKLVADGGFRYISPEWYRTWTDPATQQEHKNVIVGGAITTRPFFKDKVLRALVASEQGISVIAAEDTDDGAEGTTGSPEGRERTAGGSGGEVGSEGSGGAGAGSGDPIGASGADRGSEGHGLGVVDTEKFWANNAVPGKKGFQSGGGSGAGGGGAAPEGGAGGGIASTSSARHFAKAPAGSQVQVAHKGGGQSGGTVKGYSDGGSTMHLATSRGTQKIPHSEVSSVKVVKASSSSGAPKAPPKGQSVLEAKRTRSPFGKGYNKSGTPRFPSGSRMSEEAYWFRDFAPEKREELAKSGDAMPDGSFPIPTAASLKDAIQSIGRAKDPAAVKSHIKKRAKELGQEDLIPDSWSEEISMSEDTFTFAEVEQAIADAKAAAVAEATAQFTEKIAAAETEATEAKTERDALKASVGSLEKSARVQRFTDMVAGRGGATDGAPWAGDPVKHVEMLEHLSTQFGEEHDLFTHYVENEQAVAAQVKEANLFSEIGTARGATVSDPERQLDSLTEKRMTAHPDESREQAYTEVLQSAEGRKIYSQISTPRS